MWPWVGALAAIATVVVGVGLDLSGTQLGVPHPPFIGACGPRANVLLSWRSRASSGAVALVPSMLRARAGVFAAALFAITLILRVTLSVAAAGRTG